MILFDTSTAALSEGLPVLEVHRPVTPKQIAESIGGQPFAVIADLLALNCFSAPHLEIPDDFVTQLGDTYGVLFIIR